MKSLLAGVFFSTAVVGFAGDLVQLNVKPLGRGFFWPAFFGAGATVGLIAAIKKLRSPVLIFIVVCWIGGGLVGLGWLGLGWFTYTISLLVTPWPMPQPMKARIVFDAIGITISGGLGFRLLLSFVTHEGLANVRMQTELALAHGIQARLVPDISRQMVLLDHALALFVTHLQNRHSQQISGPPCYRWLRGMGHDASFI